MRPGGVMQIEGLSEMFRSHFPLDRVSHFCANPSSVTWTGRAELARHLLEGCRRCWSAVDDIAPGSVVAFGDPVAEALHHVATPQSLPPLSADHLAAVRAVRDRPLGFGFLLVEEAFALDWDGGTSELVETDIFEILGSARSRRRDLRHREDLFAVAMAYLSMLRTKREELDAARSAWLKAERHRQVGTGEERIRATVLEARALLAAVLDDARHAEELLTTAISFLAPDHAVRRFELYGRLADVLIHAGDGDRVPAILARANHLLAATRESKDLISRAHAIYSRARLTAYLAARLAPRDSLMISGLRWAAAELEDARELFETKTDARTRIMHSRLLVRLYSFFDTERATEIYSDTIARPYCMTTGDPVFRDLQPVSMSERYHERGFSQEERET